jgi:hypothetical protein
MRRSASRRRATEPRPRRTRLLAAAGALVVFGALIGVTQISNADESGEQASTKITVNGLDVLANDCSGSTLEKHDGFQKGDRCVSTQFGEVGSEANNPTLLIVSAPRSVEVGTPFTLRVSTRNLIRDRFLAAGQGGYYVESSVLQDGVVRGHFHTACRLLGSTRVAPDPAPVPAFFVATEDRQGGRTPDTVSIQVPGLPEAGTAQCASWAGDGSHRIPMMQRANQTPAFDAVRIRVRAAQNQPPAEEPPAEEPPAEQPPAEQPPAEEPPAEQPPAEQPPAEEPPAEQPPAEEPPAEQPPAEQPPADNGGDNGGDGDQPAAPPAQPQTNSGTVSQPVVRTSSKPAAAPAQKSSGSSKPTGTSKASADEESDEPAEQPAQALTGNSGKKIKPQSAATEANADEPDEAGAALAGDDGAPDPETPGTGIKPAAAQSPETDKLALTGNSTLAVIAGGVVVALIGFVILSASRRRRPRATHYYQ